MVKLVEIYWVSFIFGLLFAFVTIIFDDIIGHIFDGIFDALSIDGLDFINPMVIVGGITVFGGTGIILNKYTFFEPITVAVISILLAIIISTAVYFFYVKPMQNTENSTGYSINDLVGEIGEVIIPVPTNGYGEVLVKVGTFNTNHIAASFNGESIQTGTRVVVIEVKDNTLYVSRFENI